MWGNQLCALPDIRHMFNSIRRQQALLEWGNARASAHAPLVDFQCRDQYGGRARYHLALDLNKLYVNARLAVATLTAYPAGLNSMAFSPDGKLLARGSYDHTIWL